MKPFDIDGVSWLDLRTKGFVHAKAFLTDGELSRVIDDYRAQAVKARTNGNYDAPLASPLLTRSLESKVASVSDAVRAATGLRADVAVAGLYFSTEKGVNFAWHQDHESYFIYQQHSHYLNFYVPIVKPDPERTNLCLVPFDALERRVSRPDYQRLIGSGAARFLPDEGRTLVSDDEHGEQYALPVNIEELKVTPRLEPGDLLLLRGDMIHRTEDTQTDRVALSLRRTRGNAVIRKAKLVGAADFKRQIITNNKSTYGVLLECFEALRQEEITAKQFTSWHVTRGVRA
jgi:ectoine hydroxylase-related dioxygenase (phytanoyl-CoA dioxygenase family)